MTTRKKEQLTKQKDKIFHQITEGYLVLLAAIEKKFGEFDADICEKDFHDALKSMINVNKFMNELPAVFDKIFLSQAFREDSAGFITDKLTKEETDSIAAILQKALARDNIEI